MKNKLLLILLSLGSLNANQLFYDYSLIFVSTYFQRIILDSDSLYNLLSKNTADSNNEKNHNYERHIQTRKLHDIYDSLLFLAFWASAHCYSRMEERGDIIRGIIRYSSNYRTAYEYSFLVALSIWCLKNIHLIGRDIQTIWKLKKESKKVSEIKGLING